MSHGWERSRRQRRRKSRRLKLGFRLRRTQGDSTNGLEPNHTPLVSQGNWVRKIRKAGSLATELHGFTRKSENERMKLGSNGQKALFPPLSPRHRTLTSGPSRNGVSAAGGLRKPEIVSVGSRFRLIPEPVRSAKPTQCPRGIPREVNAAR